jgi:hypothetical protein
MLAARTLFATAALIAGTSAAFAEGNFASQLTELEPLVMSGADLTFSVTEYELETGKYYKWRIESDGLEEFRVNAPELWRASWINQVVINDIEVKPLGGIYGVEFDDEGGADIYFVPLMPGNYEFSAPGFEERGMTGTFVVR